MQTATIQRRIETLPALSRAGKRINGLHRLMRSPYLFERAYSRVARNKGALTPGIDGETFDGATLEKLARLARRVADGTYRPRPVRRVYIPKASGKLRPLGIPTVEDRLVQEVVRILLEAIYEPVFSQHSHGFRPGRSCHTALDEIRNTWTGCKWLIEVDVRGFFDLACWYPPQQADRGSKVRRSNLPALSFRNALSVRGTSGNRYNPVWASSVMAIVPLWMRS